MFTLPRHLVSLSITLWVGGMWLLGFVVVPALFEWLPDRQLAGMVAGRLFTLQALIGIVCALYLLVFEVWQHGRFASRHPAFRLTLAMLLLVLVGEFILQPILADLKAQSLPMDVMSSSLASRFKMWHAVSGTLYLIQSLLGIALVLDSRIPRSRRYEW